jgi:hypothetical protein
MQTCAVFSAIRGRSAGENVVAEGEAVDVHDSRKN